MATRSRTSAPKKPRGKAFSSEHQPEKKGHWQKGISSLDIERRVWTCFDLLLKGYTYGYIKEVLRRNAEAKSSTDPKVQQQYRPDLDWGVTDRTINEYLARAKDMMKVEGGVHYETELHKYMQRNELLFRMAVTANNVPQARLLEKDRKEFFNLDGFELGRTPPDPKDKEGDDPIEAGVEFKLPDGTIIRI